MKTNQISKSILCAMLLLVSSMAHASIGKIGSCWGNLSTTGYSKTGKGRISAAVVIPRSDLQCYDGARITAIRVGLVTVDGISNLTAWTRHSVEGSNLFEENISSPEAGWNEVALSSSQTIDASDDLVLGYSFDQAKSVKCLSVAGEDSDDGCWIAKDDSWQNRSSDFVGSLSIELCVEGDMVPAKNLRIESLSVDSSVVYYRNTIVANVCVRNTALEKIDGYVDYKYTVGDDWRMTENCEISLAYGETTTEKLYIPAENLTVDKKLLFSLSAITDGDEYAADNNDSLYLSVYDKCIERKVLLEEFTSEHCSNCPRAIKTIEECMEAGYDKHLIQISHHVGYKYDWLTVEEDTIYEWFYGDNGTFAPAGMLDRTQRDAFSSSLPVFSIGYSEDFMPMLDIAISQAAFVEPKVETSYDQAERKIYVKVDINKLPQLDVLCAQPRLTVILLEDSILHHAQAGYDSQTFRHRHVYRKCLSDMWGDIIKWNGSTATLVYSYTLPDDWDEHYVEAVAFVSTYNADNRNECQVYNTGYALNDLNNTSVQSIATDRNIVRTEYYDLSGRKLNEAQPGLNIKKDFLNTGQTVSHKVVLPKR